MTAQERVFIDKVYSTVISNGNDEQNDSIAIPNGKILYVKHFNCSAPNLSDIFVKLVWDKDGAEEEYIVQTSSSSSYDNMSINFTGDGSKKLSVLFCHHNTSEGSHALTCSYKAYYEVTV